MLNCSSLLASSAAAAAVAAYRRQYLGLSTGQQPSGQQPSGSKPGFALKSRPTGKPFTAAEPIYQQQQLVLALTAAVPAASSDVVSSVTYMLLASCKQAVRNGMSCQSTCPASRAEICSCHCSSSCIRPRPCAASVLAQGMCIHMHTHTNTHCYCRHGPTRSWPSAQAWVPAAPW